MDCVTHRRRYRSGNGYCICTFDYKGVHYRIYKREHSDVFRACYEFGNVKSFVTVYAPFNWSDVFDLEYLYRKTCKAYREVCENLACLRKYNSKK